jgi:hypothetical protein
VLFRSCGRNFQDFYGQVITLCGLRLKFDRHAIILIAMEARRSFARDSGRADDSTGRGAFVRLGAWRHT